MQASQRARFAILAGVLSLILYGCAPPSQVRPEAAPERDVERAVQLATIGEHA